MDDQVKEENDSSIPSAEMKPMPELKAAPPFTPGPWYISETSSNKKGVFSEAQPVAIVEIIGFPLRRKKNSDANARLIAAAPELYAACLAITEWDKAEKTALPYDDDGGKAFRERIRLCDEAMTKAAAALALAESPTPATAEG
jgi:hypothetical protein